MPTPIPNQWLHAHPGALVTGNGSYALTLGSVLGSEPIPLDDLCCGPQANAGGGYTQVLENLARALFVVPESMSAADALRCHAAVWDWVAKLAPEGDQHELAFTFILSSAASKGFEGALAAGLGISKIDPALTGHAVWRRSGSLTELLDLLASIRPMDLLPLRARRFADTKHATLAKLHAAIGANNATAVREAAREVLAAFSGCEYLLDVFCQPPSHQHGNLLRSWLNATVTEAVTQESWMESRRQIANWLARDLAWHTQ